MRTIGRNVGPPRWASTLNVQDVRTTRPNDVATPPDVTCHVRRSDGNETATWGEITDVYYDETEARLLWSGTSKGQPRMYTEPDAQTADEAEKRVERKLKKYLALVSEQWARTPAAGNFQPPDDAFDENRNGKQGTRPSSAETASPTYTHSKRSGSRIVCRTRRQKNRRTCGTYFVTRVIHSNSISYLIPT